MKSGLLLLIVTALAAPVLRGLGLTPAADLAAVAYLVAATVTFGRPLASPSAPTRSR
jgi:hypothetical protein